MRAADHTRAMLAGFHSAGVDRVDLAVRGPEGIMRWQRNRPLEDLPLAWLRAANVNCSEIYIRPARGFDWPLVFLDDVTVSVALEVIHRHGGLAVMTSARGGCHLWLPCGRPLDEAGRCRVQRWLAGKFGADPASISGEHLGRLAGFKNWKRSGCWVNVLGCCMGPREAGRALNIPPGILEGDEVSQRCPAEPGGLAPQSGSGRDTSPSGMDWAWVCNMLEAGMDPETVRRDLVAMSRSRRGPDTERYAQRTVERALVKVGMRLH
jgi:hypothetical protein